VRKDDDERESKNVRVIQKGDFLQVSGNWDFSFSRKDKLN